MNSKFPIYEPGQPEDFSEILAAIDVEFIRTGVNWESERVHNFVLRILKFHGVEPPVPAMARYLLSHRDLEVLHRRLVETPRANLS